MDFVVLRADVDPLWLPRWLALLVLSVAVMAFLFGYEPFKLYFDNKRGEAIRFFAKTLGFFALFAAIFLLSLLAISF